MRLSEVFDVLASGELANRFMADGGREIKEDKKEVVARSINLALSDLYNRFFLKRIVRKMTTSSDNKVYKVDDPLFIEIHKLYLNGKELFVNRDHGYHLLTTNTIVLKDLPNDNGELLIEYKANHRKLTKSDIYQDTEIELPTVYLNALCLFIGSRLYTSIVNQLDGDLNESARYAQQYLQEIQMLESKGVDVDDVNEMWLFHQRGFI